MDSGLITVYTAAALLALTVVAIIIIIIYQFHLHITKAKKMENAAKEDLNDVFVISDSRQNHSTPAPPTYQLAPAPPTYLLAKTTLQPFRELFTPHSEDNRSAQEVDDLCVSQSFVEDPVRKCSWNYSFVEEPVPVPEVRTRLVL